jgi:hypothetical protein
VDFAHILINEEQVFRPTAGLAVNTDSTAMVKIEMLNLMLFRYRNREDEQHQQLKAEGTDQRVSQTLCAT